MNFIKALKPGGISIVSFFSSVAMTNPSVCVAKISELWKILTLLSPARARAQGLDELFEGMVEVPRIRHGSRQTLETLINEEAYWGIHTRALLSYSGNPSFLLVSKILCQ